MLSLPRATRPWLPLRRIDLLWLLVMAALAALASTLPRHSPWEFVALGALAAVQIAEMRFAFFERRSGAITALLLKLALGWFLVGVTDRIESSYYLIFLLPVVTAASVLGLAGTMLAALAGAAAYCSFLLLVPWEHTELTPTAVRDLGIRVLFLFLTGILLNHFATENRSQTGRYRKLAGDLSSANRSLGEAQSQIRRSDRLAALGQLSAGLAHELRNPLGVIRGSAELLARNVSPDNQVAREMAALIAREVDRSNALVTRFLEFARPTSLHRTTNDLHAVIQRAIALVLRDSKSRPLRVETDFSPGVPPFVFDAQLLEQVFFNLMLNGAQAMPEGGAIRVATRLLDGTIETAVTDMGTGIPEENLESIFNPFFTTKPDGVGLGLAIVSKIVDDHGGKISVWSRPGQGTTFRVCLPAGAGSA